MNVMGARYGLKEVETFLVEWVGEVCPDHDPECVVCQAWDAYRHLLAHLNDATTAELERNRRYGE